MIGWKRIADSLYDVQLCILMHKSPDWQLTPYFFQQSLGLDWVRFVPEGAKD